MVNCYEFLRRETLSHTTGLRACMGILRQHFRGGEKNQWRKERKGRGVFLRRGLNGFTICFGGAGSCIITCLLVHCLSSSVSQLKQPSVCSYFRKRWHTNQESGLLGSSAYLTRWSVYTRCRAYKHSKTKPSVECRLSPAGLQFTKTSHFNRRWKDFNCIIMTSIIVPYSLRAFHISLKKICIWRSAVKEILQTEALSLSLSEMKSRRSQTCLHSS